ncbi:MAG: A/G-specific adenine glycosylase, partial [Bacteroidetes bacterium QH_2_63_10]
MLDWYDENKRSMPWRDIDDPYRIWVAEIMLQQTR